MKINARTLRGGVNTSNNATFRFCDLKSNLIFLLRRIANKPLCHSELGSESRDVKTKKRVQGDKIFKKAFAFTLAETLIVMGIIGVVAALTIPNLNSSTADKEKVAKVKKIYSNLNDALGRAQAVYGPIDEWKADTRTRVEVIGDRITEFMKVSKNCGMKANQGCLSKKVYNIRGYQIANGDDQTDIYKFLLADGTSVRVSTGGSFSVDIDGPNKGSGVYSKDLFGFSIVDGQLFPQGYDKTFSERITEIKDMGYTAAAWVIDYDNMDYLKLDSSKKCPNGTTPTEQNPRCK